MWILQKFDIEFLHLLHFFSIFKIGPTLEAKIIQFFQNFTLKIHICYICQINNIELVLLDWCSYMEITNQYLKLNFYMCHICLFKNLTLNFYMCYIWLFKNLTLNLAFVTFECLVLFLISTYQVSSVWLEYRALKGRK